MARLFKIAATLPVCLIALWSTATLMAQQRQKAVRRSQTARETVVNGIGTRITTATEAFVPQPDLRAINTKNLTATHSIKLCKVQVADGMATVDAQVVLSNRLGRDVYIWRLNRLDEHNQVLDQIPYDTQVFGMEADGAMEPTFHEVMALAPGTSQVQLSLFAFQPGADPKIFKDDGASRGYLILRRVTKL